MGRIFPTLPAAHAEEDRRYTHSGIPPRPGRARGHVRGHQRIKGLLVQVILIRAVWSFAQFLFSMPPNVKHDYFLLVRAETRCCPHINPGSTPRNESNGSL